MAWGYWAQKYFDAVRYYLADGRTITEGDIMAAEIASGKLYVPRSTDGGSEG